MKPIKTLTLMLSLALSSAFIGCGLNSANISASNNELKSYTSNLPFKMPDIITPKFQNKDFIITAYGAKGDGLTKNTDAFEKTISECNKAGGGRVVVPAGTWLTGPIKLKSNVNLYLDSGAVIVFSNSYNDYKNTDAKKSSSTSYTSLISGTDLSNVAITGGGALSGNGDSWRPVKKEKVTDTLWKSLINAGGVVDNTGTLLWPSKKVVNIKRPNLLSLSHCSSILIDGPTFKNSPQFNVDITSSQNITIRNTKVFNDYWAQNTDGLDISACKDVLMYNDTVDTGDDGICMKSSASGSTKSTDPKLQNVVIENCIVNHAHGGFVIGSNTDGGMKNIYVHNCNYTGTDTGIRFKSNIGNGGTVEDVYIDGINMKDITTDAVVFDTNYESKNTGKANVKVPCFQNIHISNVVCSGAKEAVNIKGLDTMPVKNIDFKNITINSSKGFFAENTSNITLDNVKITPSDGAVFTLKNSSGYTFNNILCPTGTDTFISLQGSKTNNIQFTNTDTSNAKKAIDLGNGVISNAIKIN